MSGAEGRGKNGGPAGGRRSWRKGLLVGGLAIGLQGAILLLALMIGVLAPPAPKEAKLRLPEGSPSEARERQQAAEAQVAKLNRMQAESMQQLMQPVLDSTLAEIPVNRPDVQQSFQAMGAMLPTANLFSSQMGALTDGLGADDLPQPEPVDFLGETLSAKRIVLLLDVSGSVKSKMERAGVSMEALQREVTRFVDQLGPNHLFGIIQFTRNWQAFRPALSSSKGPALSSSKGPALSSSKGPALSSSKGPELVPATEAIRKEAHAWINSSFRTTGTAGSNWTRGDPNGIEGVLAAAFAMDVEIDEIFVVSDGDFQRTPPGGGGQDVPWGQLRDHTRRLQEGSIGDTRLRVLCYYPPEDALPDLRAWVRENGDGTLRVIQ